jgi:hypothetical protein
VTHYEKESCETTDRLAASTELQELKKALVESHLILIMPEASTSKTSIQSEDSLSKMIMLSPDEPSKVTHGEYPRSQIGTRAHKIPLGN